VRSPPLIAGGKAEKVLDQREEPAWPPARSFPNDGLSPSDCGIDGRAQSCGSRATNRQITKDLPRILVLETPEEPGGPCDFAQEGAATASRWR